jgi:hypothetical protein
VVERIVGEAFTRCNAANLLEPALGTLVLRNRDGAIGTMIRDDSGTDDSGQTN